MKDTYLPEAMRLAPRLDSRALTGPPVAGEVLLINPFYAKSPTGSFNKHVLTPSLALPSLAGATPPGWRVRIWDENLLQGEPPYTPFPQVVGITVHLTFARRACELAGWYRRRGAVVVLGGPHVLSCPEELRPHADVLCFGNGVAVWPTILADIAADRLLPTYHGSYLDSYAAEPEPRCDLLPAGSFLTRLSVSAVRGCNNRCDFCHLSTAGLTQPLDRRRVEDVVADFAASPETFGVFLDNNVAADPDYLQRLCDGLAGLRKIWSAALTLDVTDRPELVRAMALAGCTGVFVGLESLDDRNLRENNKRCPRSEEVIRRLRVFTDNGIQVNGGFVLGFDHDGPDVFARTAEWIDRARLTCATFNILTPYPGTPLFRRLQGEGRLLHTNWELYDTSHCVFQPARMTPSELEKGYAWLYKRLFSLPSILARRPRRLEDLPSYLLMTLIYKRTNLLWASLIRHRLTHLVWRPVLRGVLRRQLRWRRRLARRTVEATGPAPVQI